MQLFTPRLAMRQLNNKDWPLFLQLHREPQVLRYCYDMPSEAFVRNRFELRVGKWDTRSRDPLCLVVTDKVSGVLLGVTGFTYDGDTAELGYLFMPEYFGHGYATESLRAVIDWAWNECKIHQYKAVVTRGNVNSEKVLSKCGLTHTDTLQSAHTISGKLYDDLVYTLKL
ncbi:GNAT family N-acetyltransferase [Pseudoalteromonas sp. MMG006]|uniref:GNAT family N-acetyltransferase n=1 Tax=unclassified Pseudoalteromonas TaxID=194690 RepID=UPI001B3773FE|nr:MULTISPECIES: GNAT family N-acetyltransferase [unclassified Pseudoalteromonas]MBQ4797902.1 GNAT family N-acetyltransferase [Pseudoalteromonas sp. MMG006]MBQ4857181.1 GNAT family N-acetyltransferase [Pseudoalteromonas sp. MMG007]